MIDEKQLEIVDQLYKSILAPENWNNLLDKFSRDLQLYSVNMFAGDRVLQELQNSWISDNMHSGLQEYVNNGFVSQEMPIAETLNQITENRGFLDFKEIEKSHNQLSNIQIDLRNIRQWLFDKHGITERYLASLNPHPTHFASLCLNFTDLGKEQILKNINRANFYLPHLTNLVNVSRPFMLLKARFNAVLEVLDRFKLGVFLLSSKGDLVEKNAAAKNLLVKKDGISIDAKNRVQLLDQTANTDLHKAIDKVMSPTSLAKEDRTVRLTGKKQSGKPGLLIEVSTLLHYELPIGAMLVISDPEEKALIDTSSFSELFGLTQSEQAVCQMIAEGEKSGDIAEYRNTSLTTVQGQIKSVLSKTQSSHQTDLILLAQSINIPVDK